MRRLILIAIPLLVVGGITIGLWFANRFSTPHWRSELDQYLAYKTIPPVAPPVIVRTIEASQPWEFRSDMSNTTYGSCSPFPAAYCYSSNEITPSPQQIFPLVDFWNAVLLSPPGNYNTPDQALPSSPLPSSPEEIWCALLQNSTRNHPSYWVVYIALHEDLYNAGWIIYESPYILSDPHLTDDLTSIGCSALLKAFP